MVGVIEDENPVEVFTGVGRCEGGGAVVGEGSGGCGAAISGVEPPGLQRGAAEGGEFD